MQGNGNEWIPIGIPWEWERLMNISWEWEWKWEWDGNSCEWEEGIGNWEWEIDSHDKVDNVSILVWKLKPDILSCHLLIFRCVLSRLPF